VVAAYSPSSGLLLRRAEHSAGRACAREHRDGFRGELGLEAEVLDQLQADVRLRVPGAWDAWDGVRPDVVADAGRQFPERRDADAEKLAVRARDDPVRAAWFLPENWLVPWAQLDVAAAPYKPDADQSAARSCAEPEAAAVRPVVLMDAAQQQVAAMQQKP